MLLIQAQENGVALDEKKLLFIVGGHDNAVDEDVDEQPVHDLALNVDNVFQADDCDAFDFEGTVCEHHEVHKMHDDVQPNYAINSHADYTSDSNVIPYDQYVKDNTMPVVQSSVSSVPNDAYMMILNDMHEQPAQHVPVTTQNNVVDNSLSAKLATYKEQVKLYKRQAKFELTEREHKIDKQFRILITYRNIKKENLKKKLHSVKMQVSSTINHKKSMVAIGYKNPLYLTRAQQVQPALYNGHEVIKTNHDPAIVNNSEETLEIAKITRKKMNNKMKDPKYLKKKVKIAPHDYLKENYLATFTPQKQLTLEQIFWSKDLLKMKEEALKEQTIASRPIKALMVYPPNTPATLVPRVLPTKISRFSDMHEALNAAQNHIAELKFENSNLQNKIQNDDHDVMITENHKSNCVIMHAVKPKILAHGVYVIDVKPILPRNKNNREVHLDYLKHLKESVATLREIIKETRVEKPFDSSLASAFHPCETSTNNTLTHVKQHTMYQTNEPAIPSTRVKGATAASRSKPRSNTKKDRTLPAKSDMQKLGVHPRNNKSSVKRKNLLRTPQQNDVVERRNRTLVEAARTMLIFSKASMFLWAEAVATSCYTQNRSLIHTRHNKIPYELVHAKKPNLTFPVLVNSPGTPSSTTIDQDAPSPTYSPSSSALQSPSLLQGVAAESTIMEDNLFAPINNDPFVNVFALEPRSKASS
nr:putative ribonuclease H-like domain-containing protein [Tanacetum cinerariifolium]